MKNKHLALVLLGFSCSALSSSESRELCFAELSSSEAVWPLSKVQALFDAQKIKSVEECVARIKADQKKAEVFFELDNSVSDQEFRDRVTLIESTSLSLNDSELTSTDKFDVIDSRSGNAEKIYIDHVDGFTVIAGEDE